MLTRFALRREGRLALVLVAAMGLSGCGMSKMQDILTDKPAKKEQQQPASSPTPAAPQQAPLPPAQ